MMNQEVNRQLVAASECHQVFVFSQDLQGRYLWVVAPPFGMDEHRLIGKDDIAAFSHANAAALAPVKRQAMQGRRHRKDDICLELPSGERRWVSICVDPIFDDAGRVVGINGSWTDITDFRRLDERVLMLMREVAHRSKNMLAIVQGVANQTAKSSVNVRDFIGKFTGRLLSLGHAQDLLTATDWRGASISELVKFQLGPFLDTYGSQITTRGRPLMLKSNAAQYLGLALHELTTNAVVHGTLSAPGGHVSLSWRVMTARKDSRPYFVLVWSERGLDRAASCWNENAGFGRVMLMRIAPQAVQGETTMRFRDDGITYRLTAPLDEIVVNGWHYNKVRNGQALDPVNVTRS